MDKVVFLVLCMTVASTSAQCPPCDCFSVETKDVTLEELVRYSPLFSQAASVMSQGSNIDSVCLSLRSTCTAGNVLTEQANTFTDGSTQMRASIQTISSPGRFFVAGPTRTYFDSILGSPCPGTYTIYRCQTTGTNTCVTDAANVDVIVVSTRKRDHSRCIEGGKVIGQTAFPGLEFYDLPKRTNKPCRCDVFGF